MELPTSGYMEDISLAYEQIGGLIKLLEILKDGTTSHLIDSDRDVKYIKQQNAHNKESKILLNFVHANEAGQDAQNRN